MKKTTNSFGVLSKERIQQFEQKTRLSLPPAYIDFLLLSNGGRPQPNELIIPEIGEPVLVDFFYGICQDRQPGDLETELAELEGAIPTGLLPIGHDPGENRLLLSTLGDDRDCVYYWDSCFFFNTSNNQRNTYHLAHSFADFLDMIK